MINVGNLNAELFFVASFFLFASFHLLYVIFHVPQDVYNSLSDAGFSQRQVEGAMNATVSKGGDLHDALDWLCLNTPNGKSSLSLSLSAFPFALWG